MEKRALNFTEQEENLLINLIEKYKNIIECKKSNVRTWKDKEKIWKQIEQEFNSRSGKIYRHAKHLKEKYSNLKKRAKRKFTEEKMELNKTGGGTFTPILMSDVDIAIKNILSGQMEGIKNTFDSDAIENFESIPDNSQIEIEHDYTDILTDMPGTVENVVLDEVNEKETNVDITDKEKEIIEKHDWSYYSAKNLKQPKAKKLQVNKRHVFSKENTVAEEKLEFLRIQKQMFLEEHEIKMDIFRLKKEINLIKLNILKQNLEI